MSATASTAISTDKPQSRAPATHIAKAQVCRKKFQQNRASQGPKYAAFGLRSSPRFAHDEFIWSSCNEVTHKVSIAGKNANAHALGFVIKIEGGRVGQNQRTAVRSHDDGWWARVKEGRTTEFSFGPCATPERAKAATEAFLRREPLPAPRGDERYRKGGVLALIGGRQ
jgi:hypothetical protein